jgi:hypothetical protein
MVELVKESVPLAEKKPLMESACATAALLIAKAVNTTRRLSMVGLREQVEGSRNIPRTDIYHDALFSPNSWLIEQK